MASNKLLAQVVILVGLDHDILEEKGNAYLTLYEAYKLLGAGKASYQDLAESHHGIMFRCGLSCLLAKSRPNLVLVLSRSNWLEQR